MAGNKYIANNAGTLTEVASIQTSAGAGDVGKIPALDAAGRLDSSMMPVGLAPDTASLVAFEALSAGDLINVFSDGGAFKVRKADASTTGKEANGFVLAAVLITANATVYFEGPNTQLSSLTPGRRWLSTSTPGLTQATAPTVAGQTIQSVGFATAATVMTFEAGTPIVLA